ncbi:NADPH-dependent FMN reductase [Lacimicrobium alkaliphilum]|nr:NAD(P)H-dependent oxidoreductase [Lacimicrobium alkaliphilum]
MMQLKLQTVICSTRPGRIGPPVGKWFNEFAGQHSSFVSELVDIADYNLPVYDEPNHPRQQDYQKDHTKAWSAKIEQADAYVFVIPEYNFCPPPTFFNALNFIYNEWNYKPCGFVSYGGVSGGLRSAQLAKQLVTAVKMMPIPEGVLVQMPWNKVDDKREFTAEEPHKNSATDMLKELHRWAAALKAMRE